ncbi:MAG: phasin family protein [Candidatus Accumulibacter sp.]|jgi:poly(hydroxyalkanoate) granule-associated protein|uniref:phasin family protein n=1 Tax=Accumulibacter sp. TaxID=2053492 RepID=UPI001AD0239F|nr:phasin family protein [Accumulibacter sp.]MBK8116445.1 phasin family protein [Accumulibacter sp.]MBK8384722.1 phasin family protein [Accumulibacter sp.]MBK8578593.1 phasin family protein [Candidatus Accumulibacter propinquus]MBN8436748.1 phasin family protein [Accumulibacter sp.]
MGKKLKELAGSVTENQLASTVKESAQQIWLAGLGAFAKAQEEGGKVFDALVKEGENIQSRTRKITDERIAQVAGKASGTWDRLEQVFEDRVARALGSLGVPSKQDIDQLSKRVVELSAAVQALTEGKTIVKSEATSAEQDESPAAETPAKPATRKPAARTAAAKPVPPVTPADVLNTIPQAGE